MRKAGVLLVLMAAAACDASSAAPEPAGEPGRVKVRHVLVAFRGAMRAPAAVSRTYAEAEVLAGEILGRAKRGEDFAKLIKDYSTDQGEGVYTLVNHDVPPRPGDVRRASFATAFTRVAFSLGIGDVGLASYDKRESPFGFHVIKRIE